MTFKPNNKKELMQAVKYYCQDKDKGIEKYGIINDWDVSEITDMSYLFGNCNNFNEPINNWDVSNVVDMEGMFWKCYNFNQSLNNWNVSIVKDMNSMFYDCTNFNQPLNNWRIGNVEDMDYMFCECSNFNQPLNNWDVSYVENMRFMFEDCFIEKRNKPSFIPDITLPSILYKNLSEEEKSENTSCPISMMEFTDDTEIIKTTCNHIFEKECLELWLDNRKNNCPICRKKLN